MNNQQNGIAPVVTANGHPLFQPVNLDEHALVDWRDTFGRGLVIRRHASPPKFKTRIGIGVVVAHSPLAHKEKPPARHLRTSGRFVSESYRGMAGEPASISPAVESRSVKR